MTPRHLEAAALAGFVAAAIFAATRTPHPGSRGPEPTLDALDALPADAALVALIDLQRARQSALGRALTASGREIPGLGRIDDLCGFDPTERLRQIGVAFPPSARSEREIGVVAVGSFEESEIALCARTTIERRGGTPVATRVGSFVTVRDAGDPDGGEIAVRRGLAMLGGGGYLRQLVDVADGRLPSARSNGTHRALRTAVETGGVVQGSWIAPSGWFEEVAGPDAALSPLAKVTAGAFRIDFAPNIDGRLVIRCSDTGACTAVAEFLQGFRDHDVAPWARRTLGLELDDERLAVALDQGDVLVALRLDPAEATAAMARVLAGPDEAPAPHPAPTLAPDEILRAAPSASVKSLR